MMELPLHADSSVSLRAPADVVFAHLDDHRRLSAHMTKRSWMMLGSRMAVDIDGADGRAVGSKIRLHGRVLGIRLDLEEAVTQREPPKSKVWETTREPRLLVIGSYRMGFHIMPGEDACVLTVFIDYSRPTEGFARWLGRIAGGAYARWCTRRMANDAAARFGSSATV